MRLKHLHTSVFIISFSLFCITCPAIAQTTRKPVFAGQFYPKNPVELTALLEKYATRAEKTGVYLPKNAVVKALILPHAGYIYSGSTAAYAVKVLKGKIFTKIIIMGPDHRIGLAKGAITDVTAFETPLGIVPVHPDASLLIKKHPRLFQSLGQTLDREHAIEVEIPFLQYFLHNFQIVPIIMGAGNPIRFADAIDELIDNDTLIVVSSDLSHYQPYAEAVQTDTETIRRILDRDLEKLDKKENRACGMLPIRVLTSLALQRQWKPFLLHYANSGDTAGPMDRVVGYTAIAYFQSTENNHHKGSILMDKKQGEVLLKVARKSIADALNVHFPETDGLAKELDNDIFHARRGTFVTLTINHQLRGCIGNLSADKSILEGVKDNAVNAAFHDPRFPPLSEKEFKQVHIEISLLTEPETLDYKDSQDLLEKLRPNVDGVIIRKGPYSATFLPQVWEQLPDKKAFLSHLCAKAGLPADEWQRPGLQVMIYQVQYFEEDR